MSFGAVIVAAGKGERLGASVPKCLTNIDGIRLVIFPTWVFSNVPRIREIVLVVPADFEEMIQSEIQKLGLKKVKAVVKGGRLRQDSVKNGIHALSASIEKVLIHDGARILISTEVLNAALDALEDHEVVLTAIPVTDTLHRIEGEYAVRSVDRSTVVAAQTPQGFRIKQLMEAFTENEVRKLEVTDEVSLMRKVMGVNAKIVSGETSNIKITYPEDLVLYEALIQNRVNQISGRSHEGN